MKEGKRNQAEENSNTDCPHGVLLKVDDESRTNESTYSEEEIEELNPIVLIVSSEKLKDAEITDYVHHTAAASCQQHRDC